MDIKPGCRVVRVFHRKIKFIYLPCFCSLIANSPYVVSKIVGFPLTFLFPCLPPPPQLPEPLILFRYYNDLIASAKESQGVIMEELEALRLGPTPVSPAQISVDLNRVLFKIRDLLRQLPAAHYKTLHFLIEHLYRCVGRTLHSVTWQHLSQSANQITLLSPG